MKHTPSREEAIANARLIAAAPDMYQLIADMVSGHENAVSNKFWDRAVGLLRTIEGKS